MRASNNLLGNVKDNLLPLFILISISVAFFLITNIQLLNSGFYNHINIAFDFDQAWFFDTLAYSPSEWKHKVAQDAPPLLIKHPFLYLYHIPCAFLQILGFSPELSVLILSLIFHTGTLALSYYIFLKILESSVKATLITMFMMLSSTYIINGIVLDTYVLAGFWIACCFALYIKELTSSNIEVKWLKMMVYVMAVGTTTYLLLLAIIFEISLIWSKRSKHRSKEMVFYLTQGIIKFLGLFFILFCLIYYQSIIEILSNPVDVIKRTLWAVARPGEKEGIISILGTFLVHTFIAPFHTIVEIEKDVYMADFRNGEFHILSIIFILALVMLYILSLKSRNPLLFVAMAWLIITMTFHIEYQDRGSLFLYTGHTMLSSSIIIAFGLREFNVKKWWAICGIFVIYLAHNNLKSIYAAVQSVF